MPLTSHARLKLSAFVIALTLAFVTGCTQNDSKSPRIAESPNDEPQEPIATAPSEPTPTPVAVKPTEQPTQTQRPPAMQPVPVKNSPSDTSNTQPKQPTPAASEPASEPVTPESKIPPATYVPPWAILREPFDPIKPIIFDCKWTGGIRLEINTDNVQRITLDLYELPPDAPQQGPWRLQIDRQGIEITGRRGKVSDVVRSPNGVWSVDRESAPLRR